MASQYQAIPQPKPHPILGNIPQIDPQTPVQGLMALGEQYGPIYQLHLPGDRFKRIFVSSARLMEELADESRFDKTIHVALEHIRDFAGDGLFTARTDEPNWQLAHQILMPAFSPLAIRDMLPQMYDVADQMLMRWERFGEDEVIDVADHMTRLTLDTIALCAFDYRFNSFYQDNLHPFIGSMVGALAESGARTRRIPIVSKMMLRTRHRYESDIAYLHAVADQLIAERKQDPRGHEKQDLLSRMLFGKDPKTGKGLSDENIRYQMVTFLIAGHETTSGLLSFALYYLLQHPEIMDKARAEVDRVLGEALPSAGNIGQLSYIEQILKETLRIWPTAPAIGLHSYEDTTLGGKYRISPRDNIIVLLPNLHRDPEVWGEDVEAFRPERFAPGEIERIPQHAWKPFGNGQRACIGRPFAMQEAILVLASILQRFEILAVDPAYQLKVKETLTLKPENFRIRVRRREEVVLRGPSFESAKPEQAAEPEVELGEDACPLLVLYGSDSGSSESLAKRIQKEAAGQGYRARIDSLDAAVDTLPTEGAVVIVTASYEGQPTHNAKQFVSWLEQLPADALQGVRYTVFGCGNRDWVQTYQAVPTKIDRQLAAAGAERLKARGEADASGDFYGDFEAWYEDLWSELGQALGLEVREDLHRLEVEHRRAARPELLKQGEFGVGEVLENRELVDLDTSWARSKRHIEIRLPEGMAYRSGDYLSVLPINPRATVQRVLTRFGLTADEQIVIRRQSGALNSLPAGYPVAVTELLSQYLELSQPVGRRQLERLIEASACPPEKQTLSEMLEHYEDTVLAQRISLLDTLERSPACDIDLEDFLSMLPPLRPRQYSISSSPRWRQDVCSLTLAVVDAPAWSGQGEYYGVASTYLAGLNPGSRLWVSVRPSSPAFHPPQAAETPIILVAAGSGLAPFRGFLQERALQKQAGEEVGPALLFFGCGAPEVDYLYREQLQEWESQGVVELRPAFSRHGDAALRYVQDRLWRDRQDVVRWFRDGASIFVCGDGKKMAPAVRDTMLRIYQEAVGEESREVAEQWAQAIEHKSQRYVTDVFT